MASRSDNTSRNVIPAWNDFYTTSKAGELIGNNKDLQDKPLFNITSYVQAWEEQRTLAFAGDLLSAAIMNRQKELPEVHEAALFVIEQRESSPISLYNTAKSILDQSHNNILEKKRESTSIRLDYILNRENIVKERISFLRKLIQRFQFNPIWYVELSRAYVTLGMYGKAKSSMLIAVHLAPESRYVTRSASRLFLHLGDFDRAHYIIAHSPSIKHDPWLLASEIAINALRGRNSRFIKDGFNIVNSDNYSPFSITELSSALGTKELETSRKKGKILITKSLIQPNDNSLSQADWLMNVDKSLDLNFTGIIKPIVNLESDARFAFLCGNYEMALSNAVDWIESAPFTKSPINFAAEMAYTYQHCYEDAEKILQIGLKCNPNDVAFLNNLAYAYALDDKTDDADKILMKLKPLVSSEKVSSICATATEGLNEYRKGNREIGSLLYLKAIEDAKEIGDINLAHKAILNNIREEVRLNPNQDKNDVSKIIEQLYTGNIRETEAMKNDILSYLK